MLQLLYHFSWQELRQHPWRTATALVAIMLGVALGFAVHVINQSALDELSRATRSVSGQPDLQFKAMHGDLPQALYSRIAGHTQVARAAPWIEVQGSMAPPDPQAAAQALRLVGGDALQFAPMAPGLMPKLFDGGERMDLFAPDAVFLNASALQALGLTADSAQGQWLHWHMPVQAEGTPAIAPQRARIAGTVSASGPPLAWMDIAALQERSGQTGLQRIDVLLAAGASAQGLLHSLRQAPDWPAQVLASAPEDEGLRIHEMSRAYRVNLTVLALVAMFTGAFLVYSVLSLSVAQRTPQLALLAVLGTTPAQRMALVLWETLALGVVGSVAGLLLGGLLAWSALHMLGGDLGGGYFSGAQTALQWSPLAAAAFGFLGVLATLAGGWWPALQAMRLPAATALKGLGSELAPPARLWPALMLLMASVLLALLPPIHGMALAAYGAMALLLLAGMLALPWLLGGLLRAVPQRLLRHALPMLAVERARRMRHSTIVAIGGVVASLSLAVALTVMVTSFRASMQQWLDAALPAQLYVRAAGSSGPASAALLPLSLAAQIAALPGVQRAQAQQWSHVQLQAKRPAISVLARPLHGPQAQQLPWTQGPLPVPPGHVAIYVSEAIVHLYGVQPGQSWPALAAALAQQPGHSATPLFVAGVWRDYVRQFGAVAMDQADYQRLTADRQALEIAVWTQTLDTGQRQQLLLQLQALSQQSVARSGPALEWVDSGALRSRALHLFDRSFAVTYWLQAVAIGIGLFGIAASFSAQVLARKKEFGLLAHLGLRRRDILSVVAAEGLAWTTVGALAGSLLGLGVAAILVFVVNPQSFHWSMELHLPLARLAMLALAVVVAGTITAWLAGRSAASAQAVLAVREDY